ncbi:MAG: HAD-IIIA family hydrolase [Hyphomicrobium sp.]
MLAQAVILCGGLGTRLGTLTSVTPKPLLQVAGRPFLDHLIQEIARYGVPRITLVAGHMGEQLVAAYDGRRCDGATIEVLVEPTPMGTGGALLFARSALASEFLLMNGDSWIDEDLVTFSRSWRRTRASNSSVVAQLLLQYVADSSRFGLIELSDSVSGPGLISSFSEKPNTTSKAGLINAGVYILDRMIVDKIAVEKPVSLERDVLPTLVAAGRVAGVPARRGSYFVDIGVPDSFESAQMELLRHRTRPALFLDRDGTLNVDRGYTHRVEDLQWQLGAREAIALANRAGWYVFVVTNQAGVAHGYFDVSAVEAFHAAMQSDLFELGAHIDAFEWCPYHPEAKVAEWRGPSRRRKPEPGMLQDLLAQWPIERSRSLMIGDREIDVEAAVAAGIKGVRYKGGSLVELLGEALRCEM